MTRRTMMISGMISGGRPVRCLLPRRLAFRRLAPRRLAGAWLLLVGAVGGLTGCAYPSSPQSHADRATVAACRDHASEVYNRNHRGDIYSISQSGLPYSNSYVPGNQTNDLAQRFQNEQIVDDCVRNTGTEINRQDTAAPPGTAGEQP